MTGPEPTASAHTTGFSPRVVLAAILAAVFAAAAVAVLSAYAPELRTGPGGAHALSGAATGYAGAIRLLRDLGQPAEVSRLDANRSAFVGLMVVTPSDPLKAGDLAKPAGDRLIVLPKWFSPPDPKHSGWVVNAGPLDLDDVAKIAALPAGALTVARRGGGPSTIRLRAQEEEELWPAKGLTTGPIDQLQTVSGPGLEPLLTDDQGDAVLVRAKDERFYILSEPDLLNTQGLSDKRTARVAATMLLALRTPDQPILFDVTLNGFARSHSLLRLAMEPPFLGATLCLLGAAILVALQGWNRFGPPRAAQRAIALGKAGLVINGAGMIVLAKREPRMALRYVTLVRARTGRALGASGLADEDLNRFLDQWAERQGVAGRITRLLADAAQIRRAEDVAPLAERARQWRLEMTRDPG